MGKRRGRSQLESMDEINLTPMIDLVFLLLIVFMITTPLLENSLEIEPPTLTTGDPVDFSEQNIKTVNINLHGELFLDSVSYEKEALIEKLKALNEANPKLQICLRADGKRFYEQVMEVLGWMSDAGFRNVNLITQAEQ